MIKQANDGIERFNSIKFNYEELVIKEKIIKEESLLLDGLSFINYYDEFGSIISSITYYYTSERINLFTYYTLEDFRGSGIFKEMLKHLEEETLNYTNVRTITILILPEYYNYFKELDYIRVREDHQMLVVEKHLIEKLDEEEIIPS